MRKAKRKIRKEVELLGEHRVGLLDIKESVKAAASLSKRKKRKQLLEGDPIKQAADKRRRLKKALATSAAIRSELEKKKQKKKEEQERLGEEIWASLQLKLSRFVLVLVKARYEDEIIKFKLRLSSTMNKLLEEVGRRLDLEVGSFKLRYFDEDNDNILLACDDDLQLCLTSLKARHNTTLWLFVQLISNK